MSEELEDLDVLDSAVLNKQGWFLVTYYQCRNDKSACVSRDRAIEKAKSIDRKTGIRTLEKEDNIYFEVWEKW